MKKNEIAVVLAAVRNARDTIELLNNPSYPRTEFSSETLRDMFYTLNDFCIALSKIEETAK